MTRFVFPELFHAAAARILVGNQPRTSLRWMLHASAGMPRAVFKVWRFPARLSVKEVTAKITALDVEAGRLVAWSDGPAAAVQLLVDVPAAATLGLRAFSGPEGSGHCVDEASVAGPVTGFPVVLLGSPVASVRLSGPGAVTNGRVVPIDALVNDPAWRLVETVGMPVNDAFASSGYPLGPQGPAGAEVPPVEAAIARVVRGTPDSGWSPITDRGTAVPVFVPPDPTHLVTKEADPLVRGIGRLLTDVADPANHAIKSYPTPVEAPRSVHGTAASLHWQSKQRDSDFFPLGNMLIAAGTDAFAALALGFGTTLEPLRDPGSGTTTQPGAGLDIFMVTVEHKVTVKLEMPFGSSIELVITGELATLCMGLREGALAPPAGLSAELGPLDPPRHVDPPGTRDGRWLEAPQVSWVTPQIQSDTTPRPTGYAIARGLGAGPLGIRNEERAAGGWTPFIAADDPDREPPPVTRFGDEDLPEKFPGDPAGAVYSVAATDWFGNWSPWVSADHALISVAPQIPAVRRVKLDVLPSATPVVPANAAVEFTWDWAHRSPKSISLRLLVHADGTPPPPVNGSVFSVGGPVAADTVLDFSAATIDAPPPGVAIVAEETTGDLRTYRVVIPGLQFAYDAHPRVRVTVRARAKERVGFGQDSVFSPDASAEAASPIPPPPPFVPAAMIWSSVPDPKGISRLRLSWAPSAPRYTVYEADETTLCRELALPSPDLEVPAADRLAVLRPLPFGQARRAFKRIADNLTAPELRVELPRGSRMIHFYGIVPVSQTGAEGALPSGGNDFLAVASPVVHVPEPPSLVARDRAGVVALQIDVPETRVQVGRIEVFRMPNRSSATMPEHAGPPIAVVDASAGIRSGRTIRFELADPAPGKAWQPAFYRAVAWAASVPSRGIHGGRSPSSVAIEVVPTSAAAPDLADLQVEDVAGVGDHRLASFLSAAPLARTTRGAHVFAVTVVMPDAAVTTRRVTGDSLELLSGPLPGPAEQPDSIFRHDPTDPRNGRTYAWVPLDAVAVRVEVVDPSGRSSRLTRKIP
jgi:hypothetical protein